MRRRFLVDPPFQWSLAAHTIVLAVFLLATVLVGLWWPLLNGIDAEQGDRVQAVDAATALLQLHSNLWWIALVCLVLPLLASVRVSHRIAGPLVRVKRMLQQLADGQLPAPIQTRRKDYLQPEVALLNQAVEQLAEAMRQMQADQQLLRGLLRQAGQQAGNPADAELERLLRAAATAAATVDDSLQRFLKPEAPTAPAPPDAMVTAHG